VNDSDQFLLEFCEEKRKFTQEKNILAKFGEITVVNDTSCRF